MSDFERTLSPLELTRNYLSRLARHLGNSWTRFWFTPTLPYGLCATRIGIGLVTVGYWLSFLPDPNVWFGADGILPIRSLLVLTGAGEQTVYRATMFVAGETTGLVWVLWFFGLLASIALTIGFGGRIAALAAWGTTLSVVHRIPMMTGLLEPILTMALLYLAIGPATARWSLDAWLKRRRAEREEDRAGQVALSSWSTLATRLLQVHLVFFYVVMASTQMRHATWWDGEALWTMLASTDTRLFDLTWLGASPFTLNAATHAVVGYEWAFALLVWNRTLRPAMLAGSVLLWGLIAVASGLLGFALGMLLLGAAFLEPGLLKPAARD